MNEILGFAENLLRDHALCDNCLGRQFGNMATGTTNAERGRSLKNSLVLKAHGLILEENHEGKELMSILVKNGMSPVAEATAKKLNLEIDESIPTCFICEDGLRQLDKLVKYALREMTPYEFTSFLVGAKLPLAVLEREDAFRAKHAVKWGETIKSEFTREIGKGISAKTKKNVDYKRPDITITLNPYSRESSLQVNPLFISGRYRKLRAGIPQSKWLCHHCRGKGCEACDGTGKLYPESVEELISRPALRMTRGVEATLHAGGREDIDARVLGTGRPFVLEVKNPKKRMIKLGTLSTSINKNRKVEVNQLLPATRDDVRKLKTHEAAEKVYRALVKLKGRVTKVDLQGVETALNSCLVKQATPKRVLHRRADRIRERQIYKATARKISSNSFELTVRCQGGLYIKELIHGDDGRTQPNIADLLKRDARCTKLTVLDVK